MTDPGLERGLENLMLLRTASGSFSGEYAGTLFLIPYYVGTYAILGVPVPADVRDGFIVTSVTYYGAMRLLGISAEDPRLLRARAWFLPRGGGLAASSAGKFLLTLLGLHEYEGLNPLQPELWLLPEWVPLHPSHY